MSQAIPTGLVITQGTAPTIIHPGTIPQGPITPIIKVPIQATLTQLATTLGTTVLVVIAGLLFIQAILTQLGITLMSQAIPTHLGIIQEITITLLDHTVRTLPLQRATRTLLDIIPQPHTQLALLQVTLTQLAITRERTRILQQLSTLQQER
jgi:hypothetical protein